jgi:hypothetical protein
VDAVGRLPCEDDFHVGEALPVLADGQRAGDAANPGAALDAEAGTTPES